MTPLHGTGFESRLGQQIILFSKIVQTGCGDIQCVPGFFIGGKTVGA
jgi:hypothetical protein